MKQKEGDDFLEFSKSYLDAFRGRLDTMAQIKYLDELNSQLAKHIHNLINQKEKIQQDIKAGKLSLWESLNTYKHQELCYLKTRYNPDYSQRTQQLYKAQKELAEKALYQSHYWLESLSRELQAAEKSTLEKMTELKVDLKKLEELGIRLSQQTNLLVEMIASCSKKHTGLEIKPPKLEQNKLLNDYLYSVATNANNCIEQSKEIATIEYYLNSLKEAQKEDSRHMLDLDLHRQNLQKYLGTIQQINEEISQSSKELFVAQNKTRIKNLRKEYLTKDKAKGHHHHTAENVAHHAKQECLLVTASQNFKAGMQSIEDRLQEIQREMDSCKYGTQARRRTIDNCQKRIDSLKKQNDKISDHIAQRYNEQFTPSTPDDSQEDTTDVDTYSLEGSIISELSGASAFSPPAG